MLKSLNLFIQLLFILILVARISVSQPKESRNATKCATKCVNDMERLAQLMRACKTMTMSQCSSYFDARTERIPKSSRKCFRVDTHQSATKSECAQLLQNTTSEIKSCCTFVRFCIYPDGAKFLEQEIKNAGAHSVQESDIMTINSTITPTSIPIKTTQSTGQSTTNLSNIATTSVTTNFFNGWANRLLVATGALLLLLGSIFSVVLFKYCKMKKSGSVPNYTISPTHTLEQNQVQNSPVYCEADIIHFPSRKQHPETTETVEIEVDEPEDFESVSEHEYCYPEAVNPLQASGEYACSYDHLNINADYVNTFPCERPTNGVEDDDYEYPQNRRSSSDNEYRYAYDWLDPGARVATLRSRESLQGYTPLDKDKVGNNCYGNYQTLSRVSHGKENETVPLEYLTVQ